MVAHADNYLVIREQLIAKIENLQAALDTLDREFLGAGASDPAALAKVPRRVLATWEAVDQVLREDGGWLTSSKICDRIEELQLPVKSRIHPGAITTVLSRYRGECDWESRLCSSDRRAQEWRKQLVEGVEEAAQVAAQRN